MESDRIHARAVVMREGVDREDAPGAEGGWLTWLRDCGIPALTGVDTRALVRHIRDKGAMRGGVFAADAARGRGARARSAEPPMAGRDLAREVTPARAGHPRPGQPGPAGGRRSTPASRTRSCATCASAACGWSCTRATITRGGTARRAARRGLPRQRPGRSGRARLRRRTVRGVVGQGAGVRASASGHQLLCRAVGLETFKLPFGHRGANHPVKDLETGRIDITSQNHGFAVLGPGGETTHRGRRAGALGDGLRRGRAEQREPLRPHGRGARPAGRARRDRPVPPRGRARARTTPLYLFDRFLERSRCRVETTSTRSSSSAPARS